MSDQAEPMRIDASTAADVAGPSQVVGQPIVPLRAGQRIVGTVQAVQLTRDDNVGIRRLLEAGPCPHPVVVAAGGSLSRTAVIGDLMARELYLAGVRALVTDGPVRDVAGLRELPLLVWSRGATPLASGKDGPGEVVSSVMLAGVSVSTGDLVLADDDGIVVWPQGEVGRLRAAALDRQRRDEARLAAMGWEAPPAG